MSATFDQLTVLKIGNLPQNLKNEQVIPILVKMIGSSKGFKKAIFKRHSNEYCVLIRFTNKFYTDVAYNKLYGKYIKNIALNIQYSDNSQLKSLSNKSQLSVKEANYLLKSQSISINTNKKRTRKQFIKNEIFIPPIKKQKLLNNNNNTPPPLPPPPPPPHPLPSTDDEETETETEDEYSDYNDLDQFVVALDNDNNLHQNQYTIKYECVDCNINFGRKKSNFEYHFRVIHNDISPFKCYYNDCDNCYTSRNALILHIRRYHHKEILYECKLCKKGFFARTPCKKHCLTHFKINRRNKKKIQKKKKINQRIKSSTINIQKIIFECGYCGLEFARKGNLKEHLCTIHDDDKWAKFQCNDCDKKFYNKSIWSKHCKVCISLV